MAINVNEWEIRKPLGQCSGTDKKIQEGEEYYGTLVETAEGFERRDFCAEFWQANRPSVYCYWKTKLGGSGRKRPVFIDDNMLMAFFDRLGSDSEPERVNFRFVLALVLMRKRRLKYESSAKQQDREVWRLRVTGGQQLVEVLNPQLTEAQIEQLSGQIGQILQVPM